MVGTPWSDGVPGITQGQISPGCSFSFTWKATQNGPFYYHAQSSSQIDDGLYGPIVIHPASSTSAPYEMITKSAESLSAIRVAEKTRVPLLISDWRHIECGYEWGSSQSSGVENPCFDSIPVNGKGKGNCLSKEQQAALFTPTRQMLLGLVPGAALTDKSCLPPSVITILATPGAPQPNFTAVLPNFFNGGKETAGSTEVIQVTQETPSDESWAIFASDLIGSLSLQTIQFSLDDSTMYIIAADGNYIEPETVEYVVLTTGQRYTVLAQLTKPKKYVTRISGINDPQTLFGNALLDFQIIEDVTNIG